MSRHSLFRAWVGEQSLDRPLPKKHRRPVAYAVQRKRPLLLPVPSAVLVFFPQGANTLH
jgi:hypothetical protein